jgi:pimeloyl-ACP methyl ester carboxylesterase
MTIRYRRATISGAGVAPPVDIAYRETLPKGPAKGVILLIHGFPQTSYQFRHVLPLLSDPGGYRCIAPDYRGAGFSSKPNEDADFRKSSLAEDLVKLLDVLAITSPIHAVGHDVGGMIAYAMASRWPERMASATWGECPMPGTQPYHRDTTEPARIKQQFHWIFHCAPDGLGEALVAGRERIYLAHFFLKIGSDMTAFSSADLDEYERAYSQPGAMRCAMAAYRALEEDREENMDWLEKHGKSRVRTMCLSGALSRLSEEAGEMALELVEPASLTVRTVPDANHYIAEENPEGFVDCLLGFINATGGE